MAKKATLTSVGTGWLSNTDLNADLNALNDQFDNTLSLDGSTPNSMGADLDMNSNDILNVGTVAATEVTVGGTSVAANVAAAAASAAAASASETAAAASETNAATSETNAAASAATIDGFEYLGNWQTSTAYVTNNIVYVTAGTYAGYSMIALSDHTSDSSSFDTDYVGGKWGILAQVGGAGAGTGDMLAANNLSDLVNAATSRTNLGVAIGSDVQAYDAGLSSIAGLTTAADKMIYTTASDTYAVTDLTAAGRALLDDANAAAQRTTLGLGTAAVAGLLDEDNMASDSATDVPSQQSVKAYVDAQVGGLTIPTTATATTSGASIDLTGISSSAKQIVILGNGVSSSGTSEWILQLGDSGGFETTGYTCQGARPTTDTTTVLSTTGLGVYRGATSGSFTFNFRVVLTRYEGSSNQWHMESTAWRVGGALGMSNGEKSLSGTLTQIRFTTVGGTDTFDAGSINIGVFT